MNAGIINPVTSDQLATSYSGNQNALASQQALLQAIQQQNGLGNQSQVYGQLQGVVNGTGPNPAQAMLNQATGQNVANQAALQAGQRGASANVGQIARQAAQQGSATQQQAVGQGATLQAQQALNALTNAGALANQQASNQIGATGAVTGAQQSEQGNLLNALQGYNAAQAGLQGNVNTANAGLANTTMQGQQALVGGTLNSIGKGVASAFAGGGMAQGYDDGGGVSAMGGPQSSFGKFLTSVQAGGNPVVDPGHIDLGGPGYGTEALKKGVDSVLHQQGSPQTSGSPGAMPGLTTTGDLGADTATSGGMMGAGAGDALPMAAMAAAKGGSVRNLKTGGSVKAANKAEKAVASGNSYANDKIPAVLSEGEYVISREDMKHPAVQNLVNALRAKKGK